jgi:hypothetical protein
MRLGPRARVVVLLYLALLTGAACFAFGFAAENATALGAREARLLSRPMEVRIQASSVLEAVDLLRSRSGVAVSLIAADTEPAIKLDLPPGSLGGALDSLVAHVPAYRYEVLQERVVVYPRNSPFDTKVQGIEILGAPRIEAATRYLDWLSKALPAVGEILPPPMKGQPGAGLYSESVTIRGRARVVEHLVQLLGDNPKAFFSIVPAPSGLRMLVLGEAL